MYYVYALALAAVGLEIYCILLLLKALHMHCMHGGGEEPLARMWT